jgi:hypothetical protein
MERLLNISSFQYEPLRATFVFEPNEFDKDPLEYTLKIGITEFLNNNIDNGALKHDPCNKFNYPFYQDKLSFSYRDPKLVVSSFTKCINEAIPLLLKKKVSTVECEFHKEPKMMFGFEFIVKLSDMEKKLIFKYYGYPQINSSKEVFAIDFHCDVEFQKIQETHAVCWCF